MYITARLIPGHISMPVSSSFRTFQKRILVVGKETDGSSTAVTAFSTDINGQKKLIYRKVSSINPINSHATKNDKTTAHTSDQPSTSHESTSNEYSEFKKPKITMINRNAVDNDTSTKMVVPQVTPSGKITRDSPNTKCARIDTINNHKQRQLISTKSPDFGCNLSTDTLNLDPKLAITSEPLLLYYQEVINKYKKQVKELQSDIKNYRRREDRLTKLNKGPTMSKICKKTFSELNTKKKREVFSFTFFNEIR